MRVIKTADLHFTLASADVYRWDFVSWLIKQVKANKVDRVDILGDLTTKKDNHPSKLVNKIIDALVAIGESCRHGVYVLKGNHDYIDEAHGFFSFVNKIPKVKFISSPYIEGEELFLPHSQNPQQDWKQFKFQNFNTINCHQNFIGAKIDNRKLDTGTDFEELFDDFDGIVFAGDIHGRQVLFGGRLIYLGAPYHINFGDSYIPAICIADGDEIDNIKYNTLCRLKFLFEADDDIRKAFKAVDCKGDQAKVAVRLRPSEFHNWRSIRDTIRREAMAAGIQLHGIKFEKIKDTKAGIKKMGDRMINKLTPQEVLRQYCRKESVSDNIESMGIKMLNEAML